MNLYLDKQIAIIGNKYISILHRIIDNPSFLLQGETIDKQNFILQVTGLIKNKTITTVIVDSTYIKNDEIIESMRYLKTMLDTTKIILIYPNLRDADDIYKLVSYGIYDLIILDDDMLKNTEAVIEEEIAYQIDYLIRNPRTFGQVQEWIDAFYEKNEEKKDTTVSIENKHVTPKWIKWIPLSLLIPLFLILIMVGINIYQNTIPFFSLITNEIKINYNEQFIPENYIDYISSNAEVNIENNITQKEEDIIPLGTYQITYHAKLDRRESTQVLTVNVVDEISPDITLKSLRVDASEFKKNGCEYYISSSYDEIDGDLTGAVICDDEYFERNGVNVIEYRCEDKSGNEAREFLEITGDVKDILTPKPSNTPAPTYNPEEPVKPYPTPSSRPEPSNTPKPSESPNPSPSETPKPHEHSYYVKEKVDAQEGVEGYIIYECSCGSSYREAIPALPKPSPETKLTINGAKDFTVSAGISADEFYAKAKEGVTTNIEGASLTIDDIYFDLNVPGRYVITYRANYEEQKAIASVIATIV